MRVISHRYHTQLSSLWAQHGGKLSRSATVRRETKVPTMVRVGSGKTQRAAASSSSPSSETSTSGAIHVIVGPMFAGKSSRLLEEAERLATLHGAEVLYLKNSKDTRYSETHIATHTGIQIPCFAVSHLIRDVLDAEASSASTASTSGTKALTRTVSERYASSSIVAIDEAQFFGKDLVEFCTRAADDDAKTVVVAGLDGDFLRGKFGYVLDMVPLADSVVKLHASCAVCGGRAVFSKKIDGDLGRQEEVGSSDKYVAVCRSHYNCTQFDL